MPTMGGLVIFATVFAGILVTLAWGNRVSKCSASIGVTLPGAMGCTLVAMRWGHRRPRGVRPKSKLFVQMVIAIAAYSIGFDIPAITLPVLGSTELGGVSLALTVLWIVAIINAVNFTDGLTALPRASVSSPPPSTQASRSGSATITWP